MGLFDLLFYNRREKIRKDSKDIIKTLSQQENKELLQKFLDFPDEKLVIYSKNSILKDIIKTLSQQENRELLQKFLDFSDEKLVIYSENSILKDIIKTLSQQENKELLQKFLDFSYEKLVIYSEICKKTDEHHIGVGTFIKSESEFIIKTLSQQENRELLQKFLDFSDEKLKAFSKIKNLQLVMRVLLNLKDDEQKFLEKFLDFSTEKFDALSKNNFFYKLFDPFKEKIVKEIFSIDDIEKISSFSKLEDFYYNLNSIDDDNINKFLNLDNNLYKLFQTYSKYTKDIIFYVLINGKTNLFLQIFSEEESHVFYKDLYSFYKENEVFFQSPYYFFQKITCILENGLKLETELLKKDNSENRVRHSEYQRFLQRIKGINKKFDKNYYLLFFFGQLIEIEKIFEVSYYKTNFGWLFQTNFLNMKEELLEKIKLILSSPYLILMIENVIKLSNDKKQMFFIDLFNRAILSDDRFESLFDENIFQILAFFINYNNNNLFLNFIFLKDDNIFEEIKGIILSENLSKESIKEIKNKIDDAEKDDTEYLMPATQIQEILQEKKELSSSLN